MATAAAMQSILASPVTGLRHRSHSDMVLTSAYLPRLQKNVSKRVRCMAEERQQEGSSVATPPPASPKPATSPTPKVRVSTKFSDVLAFSGPAPERINGRLAMIGFIAAIGAELARGDDVFTQLTNGGIPWFLGATAVFSLASLIPLFKGVSVQSKSEGVMTSDAEMWNGRFAMLGLVALVFTEYVKGGPLV